MTDATQWRQLERVKQRRIEAQESAVEAARTALHEANEALSAARDAMLRQQVTYSHAAEKLRDLFRGREPFRPEQVLRRREDLDAKAARLGEAQRQASAAEDRMLQAQSAVSAAQARLARLKQQLDAVKERARQAQTEAELARDDAQDEESEEVAVARMLRVPEAEGAPRAGSF